MYQTRELGSIKQFEKAQELLDAKSALKNIDKLSFAGPDGTRFRLVHQGDNLFTITIWSDVAMTYVVFPNLKETLVGKLHRG